MLNSKLEKVIIFGASGFIGKNLHSYFQKKTGFEVTGYSSSECDLLDSAQIAQALTNCNSGTSIILCSAIPRRREDSWPAMLKNIEMIHNLCSGIPAGGIRSFIFMSSVDVYGAHSEIGIINEETPTNPNSHYGLSKLASEMLLPIELPPRTPISILRLPGVYGPGDQGHSIVGIFVEKSFHGGSINVTGGGAAKRDFLHVVDLCQVVDNFLRRPFSGVANVATGVSTSIRDVATKTSEALGNAPAVESVPSTKEEYDLIFDTRILTHLMPDIRFMDLEQGITDYADTYTKSHHESKPET